MPARRKRPLSPAPGAFADNLIAGGGADDTSAPVGTGRSRRTAARASRARASVRRAAAAAYGSGGGGAGGGGGGGGAGGNVESNVSQSTEPCRKWIEVRRPPGGSAGFEVPVWVPVEQLTEEERERYLPPATEVEDKKEGAVVPLEPRTNECQKFDLDDGAEDPTATPAAAAPEAMDVDVGTCAGPAKEEAEAERWVEVSEPNAASKEGAAAPEKAANADQVADVAMTATEAAAEAAVAGAESASAEAFVTLASSASAIEPTASGADDEKQNGFVAKNADGGEEATTISLSAAKEEERPPPTAAAAAAAAATTHEEGGGKDPADDIKSPHSPAVAADAPEEEAADAPEEEAAAPGDGNQGGAAAAAAADKADVAASKSPAAPQPTVAFALQEDRQELPVATEKVQDKPQDGDGATEAASGGADIDIATSQPGPEAAAAAAASSDASEPAAPVARAASAEVPTASLESSGDDKDTNTAENAVDKSPAVPQPTVTFALPEDRQQREEPAMATDQDMPQDGDVVPAGASDDPGTAAVAFQKETAGAVPSTAPEGAKPEEEEEATAATAEAPAVASNSSEGAKSERTAAPVAAAEALAEQEAASSKREEAGVAAGADLARNKASGDNPVQQPVDAATARATATAEPETSAATNEAASAELPELPTTAAPEPTKIGHGGEGLEQQPVDTATGAAEPGTAANEPAPAESPALSTKASPDPTEK